MKPFDEQLTDKIRDLFDRFEEPVDPVAFESMRQNLRAERARRSAVLYRILAAAVILMAVTGYWVSNYGPDLINNFNGDHLLVTPSDEIAPPGSTSGIAESTRESAQSDKSNNALTDEGSESRSLSLSESVRPTAYPTSEKNKINTDKAIYEYVDINTPEIVIATLIDTVNIRDEVGSTQTQNNQNQQTIAALRTRDDGNQTGIGGYSSDNRIVSATDISLAKKAGIAVDLIFGSMISYTNSQFADGFGFMAGAMHSWKLNDVVSVATGGLLSFNKFEVDPRRGGRTQGNEFGTLLTHAETDGTFDFSVETSNELRYVAIDIPLNTTFQLAKVGKSSYNVTMGVSSLLYLQQSFRDVGVNYTGTLTPSELTSQYDVRLSTSAFDNKESENAFNRFDFARLMNLSVGYQLDRGANRVAVELYMKYPLGEMTSRNVSIGMGGITLRYAIGG